MSIAVTSKGTGQAKGTSVTSTARTWTFNDIVIALVASDTAITSVTLAGAGAGGSSLSLFKNLETTAGGHVGLSVWQAKILTAVASNVGVVASNANADAKAIAVYTATGIQESVVDCYAAQGSTGSTNPDSMLTASLSQEDELVVGIIGTEGPNGDTAGTWTTGTTYVSGNEQRLGTTGGADDTNITISTAAEVVATTAGQRAAKTGITSRYWTALVIAFPGGWLELQPAGNVDRNWNAIAVDADGSNIIAGAYGKRLYTSADYGATWTERRPGGDVDLKWYAAASDDDGSFLLAGTLTGRLYSSSDGGATWVEQSPGDWKRDRTWRAIAVDADGSNLIAGAYMDPNDAYGPRLYTSADSGATWIERRPAGNTSKNWAAAASDADGSHLIAGVYGGRLYTSSDGGASWTERQPAGNVDQYWYGAASDADGSHLIVTAFQGRVYTSSDGGATWTEQTPVGSTNQLWHGVASDSDGSHLIVGAFGSTVQLLYTSTDSGATWVERTPSGPVPDNNWNTVACNANGSRLVVGNELRLYTLYALVRETITITGSFPWVGRFQLSHVTA